MRNLQKPDTQLKKFWQDGEHFADIYNATMFHGKSVLCPQQLTEQDSALFTSSIGKNRDLLQKFEYGTEFILLGIENQQEIHYAMPLRTMMYDGEGYTKEYDKIKKEYRKEHTKGTSTEFLSSLLFQRN